MIAKSYTVRLTLTEPLLGTVPKSVTVYADYIAAGAAKRKVEAGEGGIVIAGQDAVGLEDEEIAKVPLPEEKGWTGFHVDDDGPFLFDYQIKGFLKEAANIMKDFDEIKIKALKSKVDNYVYVFPRRIRLPAIEDEALERPIRAMTQQGPRVSLIRSDQIAAGTVIECTIKVLPLPGLTPAVIKELFDFGELKGLGQWRNGSYGRFTAEIEATEAAQ